MNVFTFSSLFSFIKIDSCFYIILILRRRGESECCLPFVPKPRRPDWYGLHSGGLCHHHHLLQPDGDVQGRQAVGCADGGWRRRRQRPDESCPDSSGSGVRPAEGRGAGFWRGAPGKHKLLVFKLLLLSVLLSAFIYLLFKCGLLRDVKDDPGVDTETSVLCWEERCWTVESWVFRRDAKMWCKSKVWNLAQCYKKSLFHFGN